MIICLLWKLADCLSPVPEELPLKGVPLEKHHRSGFSAGRIRNAEDRKTPERQEATARKRESGGAFVLKCLFKQAYSVP